jgi:GNAT superfamily N-acetyltransferase
LAALDGQRGGVLLAGGSISSDPVDDALGKAAGDDDHLLVVGTFDGLIVGFASAHCDRDRRQPIGVVDAIYVEPSARLVGVGEAVMDLVVQWCASRGCRGVDAPALPGSRPAKAFFEDHGFVTRLLIMHHPIDEPAAGGHG